MLGTGIIAACLAGIGLLLVLFKRSQPTVFRASSEERGGQGWEKVGPGMVQNFLPDYPDDHQIYFADFPIAGITFRKEDALRFFQSANHGLESVPEPTNKHDPNAIAVYGISDEGRTHIGYIPAEIAGKIAGAGGLGELRPRLRRIFVSADFSPARGSYAEVWMQLTGPKAAKDLFFGPAPKLSGRPRRQAPTNGRGPTRPPF